MPEPSTGHEHETRDANAPRIVLAAFTLAVVVVVVLGVMRLFVPPGPAPETPTDETAPFTGGGRPALEISPEKDLAALRAEENERLESYSWVDRDRGIVAIPIERAMKLVAQHGVPGRGAEPGPRKEDR